MVFSSGAILDFLKICFHELLTWFDQYCASRGVSFLYRLAWSKERWCQSAFAAIPYQLPVQALKNFWGISGRPTKTLFEFILGFPMVLRNARPSWPAISRRDQGH